MQLYSAPGLARFIPIAIAALGLGVSVASAAAPKVSVFVAGKSFGNGKSLHVTSEPWVIAPSKLYSYSVTGTCSGVAPMKANPADLTLDDLVPAGTSLGGFLKAIGAGSTASLLKGTFENPTGKLPVVIVERKIKGSYSSSELGVITSSLKLKVQILANGQAVVDITNVSIQSSVHGKISGTIKFGKGSKVTLTTAPEVQFKTPGQSVNETDGSVKVVVWRFGNQRGTASAHYTTADGTAQAGVDYTAVSGVVKFLDRETVKTISIPIVNTTAKDGYRKFTVNLSDPSNGVVFGPRTIETIGIQSDD
jgi:hypothetical protein